MNEGLELEKPVLEMTFDLNILEHLGLRMYTSLPAVVAEFVANAWDAGSQHVKVEAPNTAVTSDYAVTITDDGCGMVVDEVNGKFLVVGRARRDEEGTDKIKVADKERRIIGRKGIGKLAGFGVAGQVRVTTRRSRQFVSFVMDYDAMKEAARNAEKEGKKASYRPSVEDWGTTKETDGTTVSLRRLKRTQTPDLEILKRHLARRFSILGPQYDFVVAINGTPISPADRDLRQKCEFEWKIENEIVKEGTPWRISGWIGTLHKTVGEELDRGVVIMARGKLIQSPTLFDIGGMGFRGLVATAYIVGEIHAEFLDDDTDEVSTDRASVIWDSEKGQALRSWGNRRLKQICTEWVDKRSEFKLKTIVEKPLYKKRIENLPATEKAIVDNLLKKLAVREDTSPETIEELADFMAEGVEYKGFLGLVDAIDKSEPENPQAVMKFLREWEILDAVSMARIIEGRLHAISKFQHLIDTNAREIPDVHNFLRDNPWLLDPTWNYVDDEIRFSDLVKKKFLEPHSMPEEDRRIDFMCLGYGDVLNAIEIKRPSKRLGKEELRQIQDYVTFLKANKGTGPRSYGPVVGYLIGGSMANDAETHQMKADWRNIGLYVYTYEELRSTAVKANRKFVDVLQRKAERTKDLRVRESHDRLRKAFEGQN